jgi:hypothetical protein
LSHSVLILNSLLGTADITTSDKARASSNVILVEWTTCRGWYWRNLLPSVAGGRFVYSCYIVRVRSWT